MLNLNELSKQELNCLFARHSDQIRELESEIQELKESLIAIKARQNQISEL